MNAQLIKARINVTVDFKGSISSLQFYYDRQYCIEVNVLQEGCVAMVSENDGLETYRAFCCCLEKCESVGHAIQAMQKSFEDALFGNY
ncbi:unnamed protein product [Gongylonema pulchrum]|uniref:PID domain-containing protein n=1 Tax=Gongylonema pulchrum TaxID=637853 RepID=A0A183EZ02_9BILA|nr:unnamed protein product [Gongylonema pulchrum]